MVVGFLSLESMMHSPVLTRAPANTTALMGSTVNMTCKILSAAHLHQEWYHGYHTGFETVNQTNESLRVVPKVIAPRMSSSHVLVACFVPPQIR